ncbi:MAG: phosphoglycerate mutase [Candidatus Diapherotrites archaeon ADurb.Bin253]|jgi:broad specificity phosphatase PhoE|nr:histidine phosphatase family protein [Candidatus Pacearchaeota archaeon]OQA68221.1 MAG: phosphoglycerate mutase [Candidatus Diapherotrites archaeon ADurb.Bin253]HQB18821.1 histidine phosphatase family protein [Candidatus Pacearchaeota archaeon]
MLKILITRHGQTKQNINGIVQGKEDGEINEKGFLQIKELIQRLKNEKIDRIISSDIPRCKITTEEILKEVNVPVEYTSLIREKDNGSLVGKSHKDFSWDELEGSFETRKAPDGENLEEVRERGRKFFEKIKKKYQQSNETILIVSHGAFLKVFIGELLGMKIYDSIFKLFVEHCSITELEISKKHKEGYRFNFINDISHLKTR